jgi:hypothetical protein
MKARIALAAMIAALSFALPAWADQAPPEEGSPFLVTDSSGRSMMP